MTDPFDDCQTLDEVFAVLAQGAGIEALEELLVWLSEDGLVTQRHLTDAAKKAGLLDCAALVAEAAKETEPDRRRLSIVAMEAVCRSRIIS